MATEAAYVVVGEPRLLGQRALLQPVEQRHAEPADRPDLREVHVGVDEAGQHQPLAQVDDLVAGCRGTASANGSRATITPSSTTRARSVLGPQPPSGERAVRGVEEGAAEDRHRRRGRSRARRRRGARRPRRRRSRPAPCSAVSPGSADRRVGSGRPGLGGVPGRQQLRSGTAPTWPTTRSARSAPRWSARIAASQIARSSAWSWVSTSTWVPGGSSASTSSGSTGTGCTCTAATASSSGASALRRAGLGPRVDQVQVEVVPGQDPGQLEPDVADPEDRHGRYDGAAARAARSPLPRSTARRAGHGALSERCAVERLRGDRHPTTSRSRARRTASSSRLPPPIDAHVDDGGDDHLGAGLARRVPAHVGHGDQHAGLAGRPQRGDRLATTSSCASPPASRGARLRAAVERPVDRLRGGRRGELDD